VEVIRMTERKTVVKIDEDLLAEAKEVLGTSSIVDTVNRALKEVIALGARRRLIDHHRALSASIDDPDQERRRAWG
jgi:Arc/MetJ family transcription regulator